MLSSALKGHNSCKTYIFRMKARNVPKMALKTFGKLKKYIALH
jgi:hypothetical protein